MRASSIASASPKPWVDRPNFAAGSGSRAASKRRIVARLAARDRGVDQDRGVGLAEAVEQCRRLAVRFDETHMRRQPPAQARRDHPAERIVAAVGIADADHDDARHGSSRRKLALTPIHAQVEEVRRAGDARIVVADRLLAAVAERVVGQVEPVR